MIGEVLDRRYRIDAEIGSGGMGVVYRATHTLIGKQVAIKVLRAQHARTEEVVRRFMREARLASSIVHPHVVELSDFGQLDDGRVYYVMELLEGRSLAQEIDLRGPLAPGRALRVALQIARGLGAAHLRGIVHRDLKPDNIFLGRSLEGQDHVKLFDFGIARAADSRLTRPGTVLGTPEYMPPEQAMGTSVDARADLYALGVILFEMLTGRVPLYAQDIIELFQLQMSAQPPTLAEVAPALAGLSRTQALLDGLMAKRPEDRPATAELVQHAILSAIAGEAQSGGRTTRAMGSGAAAAPDGPSSANAWVAPAPIAAVMTRGVRPTPAYVDGPTLDTTPMGGGGSAALAIPRALDPVDSERLSIAPTMAPTLARIVQAPLASSRATMPATAEDPPAPGRVTVPQSIVLTPARAPAPILPAAASAAKAPARRSSALAVTLSSAAVAAALTVGGFAVMTLRDDRTQEADVPSQREGDARPVTPPAASVIENEPTSSASIVAPAAAAAAIPVVVPPPASAPITAPADPEVVPAAAHVDPPAPEPSYPKPRAKRAPTTGSKAPPKPAATPTVPSKPQKSGAGTPATAPEPSTATQNGSGAVPDKPKSGGKRSIDLKDPFGAN